MPPPLRLLSTFIRQPTARRPLQSAAAAAAQPTPHRRTLHIRPAPTARERDDTLSGTRLTNALATSPRPTAYVQSCATDGFVLGRSDDDDDDEAAQNASDGRPSTSPPLPPPRRVTVVRDAGLLLLGGVAFRWRPWLTRAAAAAAVDGADGGGGDAGGGAAVSSLLNARGQWQVDASAWGALELVWPKPDLLIIGTGAVPRPLAPSTRAQLARLGVRVDVLDTRNAAAQYELLAAERGMHQVAAALVPLAWA